jgi:hypothetical protein
VAPGAEQVFPGQPPVVFGGRLLPSPAQFYVTGEDRLRIVAVNSLAGVVIAVHARRADLQGRTVPDKWTHTPNSDRTVTRDDFDLGQGSLLNVTVFAGSGSPRIGQTFVIVQLVRGMGAAAIVLGTLLAGYITGTQARGFPGSPIEDSIGGGGVTRFIQGTTPAAGVDIAETVPTGARWELLSFRASLTTAAGGANRIPNLLMASPGFSYFIGPQSGNVGPSNLQNFVWAPGLNVDTLTSTSAAIGGAPIGVELLAGHTINTLTAGLQAGDQYAAPLYVVREHLEVG